MPQTAPTHLRPHRRVARGRWIALAASLSMWGCGSGTAAPDTATIDKGVFITTYVELRRAAVGTDTPEQLDSARAAILDQNGVTQQDMLTFADVHGDDVAFMRGVWDEVERRMDATRPDSVVAH